MAIITTSRRVDFELIHKNRGIADFMDFVLCVEDYEKKKTKSRTISKRFRKILFKTFRKQ